MAAGPSIEYIGYVFQCGNEVFRGIFARQFYFADMKGDRFFRRGRATNSAA